jgi:hypothetical protein
MGFNWTAFGTGALGAVADQMDENSKDRRYLRRQMVEHGMRMAEAYQEEKARAAREVESADAVAGLYGWTRDKALSYMRLPEAERKRLEETHFMGGTDGPPAAERNPDGSFNVSKQAAAHGIGPAAAPAAAPVAGVQYKSGDEVSRGAAAVAAVRNPNIQDNRTFLERTMGKPNLAKMREETVGTVGSMYGMDAAEASRALQGKAGVERVQAGSLPTLQRKPDGFAEMSSVFLKSAPDVAKEDKP